MIDMQNVEEQEEITRTRIPKQGEVLGFVIEMLGSRKLRVECDDGFTRLCRIPGRFKKRIWIKPNNLVLVVPWKVQSNERADVIWRYTPTQAAWLKKKGYVKKLEF